MSDHERRMAALRLLILYLAFGAVLLTFTALTIHRRTAGEIATVMFSKREQFTVTWWLEHGYFHTAGMLVFPDPQGGQHLYRSVPGGYLVSGFIVEKIWQAVTGHPNWSILKLHNQFISMITSVLLALLGYRLARRFALQPFPAFALGMTFQAVYFTFPDNLWTYWEMSARGWWLPFVCVFLLMEDALADGEPNRAYTIAQATAAFLLVYMECIAGAAFLGSYVIVSLLSGERRPDLKRLALITIVPLLAALVIFKGELAIAKVLNPQLPARGRTFMMRSGFDGDISYYGSHLDIANGRDLARRNFDPPPIRPLLFQWPWLFFTSAAALLFVTISAMRGRVPRSAIVTLLSLLGAYLVYAAVFSEAVVIHPYYYDMMLFTPLMIALFILTPALIEPMTQAKGLAIVIAVFLGIWVSMVQLRDYAVWYPQPQLEKWGTAEEPCPGGAADWGPSPPIPKSVQEGHALSSDRLESLSYT